tara:strand:+ start:339 stop:1190 length:852 start_codon:yes stop_codon:yes gene_type:complete
MYHENTIDESRLRPPFAFPAGKSRMAEEMVALMPPHSVYVEPFVGSGAVFFAKEPSETEVLNDLNPDVAQTFKDLKGLNNTQIQRLINHNWVSTKSKFLELYDKKPQSPIERLYRFLYLARWSHNSTRKRSDFRKQGAGKDCRNYIETRLEPAVGRLKNTTILSLDYGDVLKRYDSSNTLFYFDPPYAKTNALSRTSTLMPKTGEKNFDENRFMETIRGLKGKFILNYGNQGELPKMLKSSGYKTRVVYRQRSHSVITGKGDVSHLISTNFNGNIGSVKSKGA